MDAFRSIREEMRRAWDERATANAMHYVASEREDWTEEEFYESGREAVRKEILTDMHNICQGRDPRQMRVIEIGCGAGRVTCALADVFGEVHAVDISREMILRARKALSGKTNVVFHVNNGVDLSDIEDDFFDFAVSLLVFQHIPSVEVIENYVREVHRTLRIGALFKFQVQGAPCEGDPEEAWIGAAITDEAAVSMAWRCGFEPRYRHGAGNQYFSLWYFKREPEVIRYLEAQSACTAAAEATARALRTLGPWTPEQIAALREAVTAETGKAEAYRKAVRKLAARPPAARRASAG